MKLVILLISIIFANSLKSKLSYESNDLLKNDLFLDNIDNGQITQKSTFSQFQKNSVNNRYNENGFINLDSINESLQKSNNNAFGSQYRFLGGRSAGPKKDEIFMEKMGLSNGVILVGRKRTCNFATKGIGYDPKIDEEIRKIEFN